MTEKDIRAVLRQLCHELDERTAKARVRRVAPLVLGAGLAIAACSSEVVSEYGAPFPDGGQGAGAGGGSQTTTGSGASTGTSTSSSSTGTTNSEGGNDAGVEPPYGAPLPDGGLDAGPEPPYKAPDPGPDSGV